MSNTERAKSKRSSRKMPSVKSLNTKRSNTKRSNTKHLGDLAELAFTYRAMLRGWIVSKPFGDNSRYDNIVDNGTNLFRVQVKSAGVLGVTNRYHVNMGRLCVKNSISRAVPYLPSEIDFLAVMIVPEDRWFIIPIGEIKGCTAAKFCPREVVGRGPFWQFGDAWHVLESKPAKRSRK